MHLICWLSVFRFGVRVEEWAHALILRKVLGAQNVECLSFDLLALPKYVQGKKSRLVSYCYISQPLLSFMGKLVKTSNNPFRRDSEYGIGAVLLGHRCLVFGGFNGAGPKYCIYMYNIMKRKWTMTQPTNRYNQFGSIRLSFIVDDVLYGYSWYNASQRHIFMAINLISMDAWVPAGRDACAETGFGSSGQYIEARNEAVLFGGKKASTDIFVYDVARSSWYSPSVSGEPPSPRYNHGTCCTGLRMFILGGQDLPRLGNGQGRAMQLDLHVLTMEGTRFVWSTPGIKSRAPPRRYLFAATCVPGRIFVYGGYGGLTRFDIYSIKQKRWYYYNGISGEADEEKGTVYFRSELLEDNANNAAVVCQGKLLIIGGTRLKASTPLEIIPVQASSN